MKLSFARRYLKWILMRGLGLPFSPHGVPAALCRHLPPKRQLQVVDAGGWRGDFIRAIDRHYGVSRGVIVEAQPARAAALAREFRPPVFEVVGCAVVDRSGEIEFKIGEFDATSSVLAPCEELVADAPGTRVRERIRVKCMTLDEIMSAAALPSCDLLKLDLQGAELLALRGASKLLKKTSFVWVEVSFRPLYVGSCLLEDVYSFLVGNGFHLIEIEEAHRNGNGELLQANALFRKSGHQPEHPA